MATQRRPYTRAETADALTVSQITVTRMIKSGQLAHIWIGGSLRVPAAEVDRILRHGTRKPA